MDVGSRRAAVKPGDLEQIERLIDQFEDAHRQGLQPSIVAFLDVEPALRETLLSKLVRIDLEIRLKRGEMVLVESYLEQFPMLELDQERLVDLLATEYSLRRIRQPALALSEYLERFPQLREALDRRLSSFDSPATADSTNVGAAQSVVDVFPTVSYAVGKTTSLGARFRILRPHARGGLGQISVARDEELNREVALKEIQQRHANNSDLRARFLQEAEITGGLEHPNIVPVYGLGQYADGRPYYAMRFIRGDSLKEAIDRYHQRRAQNSAPGERRVELRKLLGCFLDACNAIAYAHSRGVLHRDLKPGNIMLGKYGETLVVDWGLAKAVAPPEQKTELGEGLLKPSPRHGWKMTQMGSALGTPQYMSPEQAAGLWDLLGPASDVYGLGATLYCLLTGRPPFDGDDPGAIMRKVLQGRFPPPRAVNRQIARPLEAICLKAMALKPEQRYASPRDLADEVERWLAGEPVATYREPSQMRAARWVRKHRTLAAGSFGLVTAAAIGLAAGAVLINQARRQADAHVARAEAEKENAETERKKAQRQLVLSYIEGAINELEHAEPARGIAELGRAYRAAHDANEIALCRSICALLGAWQSTCEVRLGRMVHAVAFSPDGTKIAAASPCLQSAPQDVAGLWDAATGQPLGPPMRLAQVSPVVLSPDGARLATASADNSARAWDVKTGQPLGPPMQHDAKVDVLAFGADGAKLATAAADNVVRMWNVETGQPLGPPRKHKAKVNFLAFSSDGAKLATAAADNMVRVWDVETGQPLGPPRKYKAKVNSLAFSRDGAKLATAATDTARLWDVQTGQPLGQAMKSAGQLIVVTFGPDGTMLATACTDNTVQLWEAATGRPLGSPMKPDSNVTSVIFSPDGTKLAISGNDTTEVWDVVTGRRLTAPLKHQGLIPVVFSPDGTKLATVFADSAGGAKTIALWDAATGQPTGRPTKHNNGVKVAALNAAGGRIEKASIAFGPRGAKVATASVDVADNAGEPLAVSKMVRFWDADTGKPTGQLLIHDKGVGVMTLSPDGTKLATAGDGSGKTVRLWDTVTGQLLNQSTLLKHDVQGKPGYRVEAIAFSAYGAKLLISSDDGNVRQWDAATGQWGQPIQLSRDGPVVAVAVSTDGTKLARATEDNIVRLWDAATGQRIDFDRPMKHDNRIRGVAFSPDGTKLATASLDNTARLWDTATGRPLGPPLKHDDEVLAAAFSPDGARLATVSSNNTAWQWPVPDSLPDDPPWIAACVAILSRYQEDAGGIIHQSDAPPADEAWQEVARLPAWLNHRREDSNRFARGWHENEAARDEAADRWFAAVFHLRWLWQLDPGDTRWQQRLANDTEQLASPDSHRPALQVLAVDAGTGTWSPDGSRIAFTKLTSSSNGIRLLTLANNKIDELTETGSDPAWSPGDGRFVVFTNKRTGDDEEGIWSINLLSKQTKHVATGGFAGWLADGKTLCFGTSIDDKLVIQSLDLSDERATPKTLLTGFSGVYPAVSPNGQYVVGFEDSELQIWSVATKEIIDRQSLPGRPGFLPSWSTSSRQVAFDSYALAELNDLWIYDVDAHRAKRILVGPYRRPRWSADGGRMCVDKIESGRPELWLLDLQPSTEAKRP